jgi:hypothetical protein
MAKTPLQRFCFSSYAADKRDKVEQAIRDAGFQLTEHPDYPDDICIFAESLESIKALRVKLDSIASGIKYHGPM